MAAKISLDLPGGLKMPILGLGTWESKNEAEIKDALNAALEAGYRHIDTAFAYQNEKFIGDVLNEWFDSGRLKREDLFVTTKLPPRGIHQDRVEEFLKESLKNLQLDFVDLYLIHFPVGMQLNEKNEYVLSPKTDRIAIWKKMEAQVDAGRAKTIGLSNYNISQIEAILKSARIKPANLQVEIHVYLQQKELVDFCHKNGITVVAYSPLANPGYNKFLTNVGHEEKPLPDILNDAVVSRLSKKHSKSPAQIVLRFLIQRKIAPIPKTVSAKRLKENIDLFDFQLDSQDMKDLYGLDVGERARVCDWNVIPGLVGHPEYPWKR